MDSSGTTALQERPAVPAVQTLSRDPRGSSRNTLSTLSASSTDSIPTASMAANSSSRSQQAPASNFDDVEMTDAPKEITINETLKIALPDKYQGSRQELDTFLLQLEIYFRFNQDKFTEKESKSIWAVSYLRGEAGKWIQPYLRDYFEHDDRERMQPTRTIFDSFEGFKTEIRRIFGNSNELEVAEDKIFNLKQTGSALKYATEFRRYAGTTKWDEVAIMSHYRKGLKPEVRLELDREGEDDDLNGLIKSSIDADDRLYRYKQTQRSYKPQTNHRQGRYRKNEGRPRYSTQSYGDPMELDATHHRNENDDPEKRRRRENNLCFECGKAGHRAADCRSKKTGGKKGNFKPKFGKGQLNATFVSQEHPAKTEETETFTSEEFRKLLDELPRNQEGMNAVDLWEQEYYRTPSPSVTEECIKEEIPADHAMMSWTACYDKFCGIHRSDKEATGWFPKKEKTRNQQSKETDKKQVTQQLNATGQAGQIYCKVKINGQIQQAMIDSGATGNFIAPEAAKYLGVPLQKKQKPYQLQLVDGQLAGSDGNVSQETRPVQMNINQHSEVIQLDVVPLGQQQIILGMPWLKAHNPRIDWSQENRHPVQGPPLRAKASTPPLQMQKPTTRQEIAIKAEELMIPEQYKKYEHVFKEPGIHEALPEHKPWDHEIILEEGKMPVHTPIYSMSADELKTLREYIDDNLAKGWIRESTSQVASPTIYFHETHEQCVVTILRHTCCICYLDDILVYSNNESQHIKDVSSILESLAKADLLCKPSKCEFHVKETEFLGFTVSNQGLKMSKDKKKDQGSFEWTAKAQESFETLKQAVAEEPILLTFDPEKQIIVETDSSDFAIGAVLSQPGQNEKYQPIAFYSRKLSPAELNYEIYDKELLAIVDAFREWRVYLEGSKYTVQVYTDHKNLVYFTTTKQLNRRQVRWSETMANYNFKISYVKGSENARADALSRKPEYQENKSYESYAIFKKEGESLVYNAPQLAATHILEDNHLRIKIQSHYDKDATAIRIRKTIEPGFTIENETIYFHGKVYIPSQMTKEFVTEQHGLPAHGHQGIARTFARIREISYFPRMRTIVEEVVGNCDTCIRNKSSRHAPYGQLQTPDMPSQPWKSITWDFVVKLPLSKDPTTGIEYDAILNVVDRLTKFAYMIPFKETWDAEQLAYVFLRGIYKSNSLKDLQEQLALDLRFISSRTAAYYNTKRSMEPTLKEGDKVYLLRRNIETKRPSNKLDHRKLGPFKIDKVIGTVNYRLKLPDTMNIHPVFHISLLEPAPPGAPNAPFTEIEPVNPNAIYDVETILDCKYIRNKVKYLIKWLDYPHSENTWELKEDLSCPEKLRAFHLKYPHLPTKPQAPPQTTKATRGRRNQKKNH
ncbi:hypothetical protein DID88_002312 [Monilinia fructigena]|uniref:RNA-directed DNA polymerase n=1 Tax=Monilinia fructigena TaxID=38457 RepID=A0A395III0_9HELO|nr:hypothetical protein DID88_002312 [Monilinia fructigena]